MKKFDILIKRIAVVMCAGIMTVSILPSSALANTSTDTTTSTSTTTVNNSSTTTSSSTTTTSSATITDDDRSEADQALLNYMNSMKIRYTLDSVQEKKLGDLFNSAVYYIAYTNMTKNDLESYVSSVQTQMATVATTASSQETDQYLQVADNWETPTVSYGQSVSIVLPIINIGTSELKNLVIEPEVTADVKTWPFEPDTTGYIQTEPFIPGYVNDDQAFQNRREFTYNFKVRDDVMTGFYELKFHVSYTIAGERVTDEQSAELSVFVQTIGKPESGYIGGNGNEDKVAKSRIIVTGYEVDSDKIYSGDTFNLTITVQNTSSDTAVTNVLFSLVAENETTGTTNAQETITPFLPTSGSNSVYMEKIGPKETTDINIEMSAKAGLAQKSYVLDLNMIYDSGMQFDLTDKTSISIPVYQESKFDMSTPEVSPASINVGGQSDVMFSIYNTGKTTLYNVQVQFSADSIENNMAFVGNLASGATGNVDVMLTGIAGTMDDGTVNVVISYEDEAGNSTSVDKTVSLFVTEAMSDMDSAGMREIDDTEEKTTNWTLIRAIIIIAVIAVIIAAVIIITSRKKKKHQAEILAEDIKDLEAINDVETDGNDGGNDRDASGQDKKDDGPDDGGPGDFDVL